GSALRVSSPEWCPRASSSSSTRLRWRDSCESPGTSTITSCSIPRGSGWWAAGRGAASPWATPWRSPWLASTCSRANVIWRWKRRRGDPVAAIMGGRDAAEQTNPSWARAPEPSARRGPVEHARRGDHRGSRHADRDGEPEHLLQRRLLHVLALPRPVL